MFDTYISRPIFNILTTIYGIIPGHSLGLTIIVFTVLMRLLLWPLLRKQLHHQKKIRELQPLLKEIKKEAAGDKKKEMELTQALYKTKEINPFSTLPLLFAQMPILIALFQGLQKIIKDPYQVVDRSYSFVKDLPHMQAIANDISKFDKTLFDFVDLTRPAITSGKVYGPALIIVILSGGMQWYQSKRLMSVQMTKTSKRFRDLLKAQAAGEEVDSSEMAAAQMRVMQYILPGMIVAFTIGQSAGLALYLLVSSAVQLLQQNKIVREEVQILEDSVPDLKIVPVSKGQDSSKPAQSTKVKAQSKTKKALGGHPSKSAGRRRESSIPAGSTNAKTKSEEGVRVGSSGNTTIRRISKE